MAILSFFVGLLVALRLHSTSAPPTKTVDYSNNCVRIAFQVSVGCSLHPYEIRWYLVVTRPFILGMPEVEILWQIMYLLHQRNRDGSGTLQSEKMTIFCVGVRTVIVISINNFLKCLLADLCKSLTHWFNPSSISAAVKFQPISCQTFSNSSFSD